MNPCVIVRIFTSGTPSTEGCQDPARDRQCGQEQVGSSHDSRGHGSEADSSRVSVCAVQRKW